MAKKALFAFAKATVAVVLFAFISIGVIGTVYFIKEILSGCPDEDFIDNYVSAFENTGSNTAYTASGGGLSGIRAFYRIEVHFNLPGLSSH